MFSPAAWSSPSAGSHAYQSQFITSPCKPPAGVPSFLIIPRQNSTYTHIHTHMLLFLLLHRVVYCEHTLVPLAVLHEASPRGPCTRLYKALPPRTSWLLGIPQWGALSFIRLLTEVSLAPSLFLSQCCNVILHLRYDAHVSV